MNMYFRPLFYTFVVLNIFVLHFAECTKIESKVEKVEDSATSVSSSSSQGPTYNAKILLQANDKDCVEDAKVEGNGVSDTLKLPCTKNREGRGVVNEENKIVIGGDPGDNHGILGNKPNALVVLEGDKCVERKYPPGGAPVERVLSDADCEAAKRDMQETKKKSKEKEEKKEEEMKNIGKDIDVKPMGLKLDGFKDPFKSMDLGI